MLRRQGTPMRAHQQLPEIFGWHHLFNATCSMAAPLFSTFFFVVPCLRFLRVSCFLCFSTVFYVVGEPIEQVQLHKWCPLKMTWAAVCNRFIRGTTAALRSWLLASGTTPYYLCKPFSCKACPGIHWPKAPPGPNKDGTHRCLRKR